MSSINTNIFSLEDLYFYQVADEVKSIADGFVLSPATSTYFNILGKPNPNVGYFGGPTSGLSRIDYNNDTATGSTRGPLITSRSYGAATSNSSYGYFGGGLGTLSSVDRVNYSNDTATASPKGPLSLARDYLSATGNSSYGWFGGGSEPASPAPMYSRIDRIDYSNDTATASPRGSLSLAKNQSAATGNSSYGYFGGGYNGAPIFSTVDRLDYSNDTATVSIRGNLSSVKRRLSATGNASYGWFGRGESTVSPASTSSVDRIDYSNDTATASPRGRLNSATTGQSSTGNSFYGYFNVGGTQIDRIDYNNDTTTASPRGPLSSVSGGGGSMATSAASNGLSEIATVTNNAPYGPYGYFAGGITGAALSSVDRVNYDNDTATASPRGPLSVIRYAFAATGNSSYGWFGGGISSTPSVVSSIDRIDYANDNATASPRGPLILSRSYLSATGNSSYGWFGGGSSPAAVSTVDRIDYSSDTVAASPRGPLSGRRYHAATGNASYGYFGGGSTTPATTIISSVDRIDYSNDTVTASPRGNILTVARRQLAATGNASYGWFGGGNATTSPSASPNGTVNRVDYANDTTTAPSRGALTARFTLSATGSTSYGYFAGGQNPSNLSLIQRIDYSNDAASASPRGPLSVIRYSSAASSALANDIILPTISVTGLQPARLTPNTPAQVFPYGYFGGGGPSRVDRIDYTNDNVAASQRGPLSVGRTRLSATGNSSYGWFGGGYNVSSIFYSTVDRIDYSNDNATASPRGPLSEIRYLHASTGNRNFGYFGGGILTPGAYTASVNRIDYTNDTATASSRGSLTIARGIFGATGNSNYGWFFSGAEATLSPYSRIDRIDYSNDTATASARTPGTLTYGLASTGNSVYGWVAGGYNPTFTAVSSVDRIEYANDTVGLSPRGNLSRTRYYHSATGNKDFGYFGGGYTPSAPGTGATVDRIQYATDTATSSPRGNIYGAIIYAAATSPTINGFPQ